MVPKVEIIIPTYNRAGLVPHAIDSALAQDYGNLSVLVIDDGSTDHTAQVLDAYSDNPCVRIICHQRNRGVTAAKNTGLDNLAADTVFFGILDSDDVLRLDAVRALVHEFVRLNNSVSQVFGLCVDAETGHATGRFDRGHGSIDLDDALSGRFSGEFWQIVRKDLLGGRRFDERAAGGEASVWHALLKLAPGYVSTSVVRVYDHSGTDRVSLERFDAATSRKKMWVSLAYLSELGADLKRICPTRYATVTLEAAKWAMLAGERNTAIKMLTQTAISRPSVKQWIKTFIQLFIPLPVLRYIREKRTWRSRKRI